MQNALQQAVKLNIDTRPTNERTDRQINNTCHAKQSQQAVKLNINTKRTNKQTDRQTDSTYHNNVQVTTNI